VFEHNQKLVKTKKAFPILLSFLAIASVASIAVLGNTQTAYAGNGCVLDPIAVDVILATGASSQVIHKTIDCSEDIDTVLVDISNCSSSGIDVSFDNISIDAGIWQGDETITNVQDPPEPGNTNGCTVTFEVDSIFFGSDDQEQLIEVTTPEAVVGGEFLQIDNTALMLAGLQSSAIWMIPTLAGLAATGFYLIKYRSNKE